MSLDQSEILQLKARVAWLEAETKSNSDLLQALGRCFIAPPTTQPQPQQPKQIPQNDPLICPECGAKKKADFKQCFMCYTKAHPKAT